MSKHRPLTAVAAALSALMLSGCAGSASPGVGVTVGDETISTSRIDAATKNVCEALAGQSEGGRVPLGAIKQGVVVRLALRAQSEQIAEDYDVSPSGTYQRSVTENTRAAALMPEEVRADYIDYMTMPALFNDVVDQVGRAKLAAEGFAEPTVEQVAAAGSDVFATWPNSNEFEFNPKYGVELKDGELAPADTELSYALSDDAKAAQAALGPEPDPAYANSLPSSQTCGN